MYLCVVTIIVHTYLLTTVLPAHTKPAVPSITDAEEEIEGQQLQKNT
jgi:hypothetical protein